MHLREKQIRRIHVEKDLHTFPENIRSTPGFGGVCAAQSVFYMFDTVYSCMSFGLFFVFCHCVTGFYLFSNNKFEVSFAAFFNCIICNIHKAGEIRCTHFSYKV